MFFSLQLEIKIYLICWNFSFNPAEFLKISFCSWKVKKGGYLIDKLHDVLDRVLFFEKLVACLVPNVQVDHVQVAGLVDDLDVLLKGVDLDFSDFFFGVALPEWFDWVIVLRIRNRLLLPSINPQKLRFLRLFNLLLLHRVSRRKERRHRVRILLLHNHKLQQPQKLPPMLQKRLVVDFANRLLRKLTFEVPEKLRLLLYLPFKTHHLQYYKAQ